MRWFSLFVTAAVTINIVDAKMGDPPIGAAMNLLDQYGILMENIRAMRLYRFHADNFEAPTVNIFKNPPHVPQAKGDSILGRRWRLDFCDNVEQLLKNYCKNYEFDGVEKPCNAFTSFSKPKIAAYLFGINEYFISDDYFSYVVLSISRYNDSQEFAGSPENLEYEKTFVTEVDKIAVGDAGSFIRFTNKVGTHYIHSFATGESVYQVFVYSPEFYKNFKQLYKTPSTTPMPRDLLNKYLSPEYTVMIGLISAVSGDPMLEQWADDNMKVASTRTYTSLFAAVRNTTLSKELNKRLKGNAVLELKLRSLAPFIKDPDRRRFFEEFFSNYLALYDVTV